MCVSVCVCVHRCVYKVNMCSYTPNCMYMCVTMEALRSEYYHWRFIISLHHVGMIVGSPGIATDYFGGAEPSLPPQNSHSLYPNIFIHRHRIPFHLFDPAFITNL